MEEIVKFSDDPDSLDRSLVAALCHWPELAGYIIIGLPADGEPILTATDTPSRGQIIGALACVTAAIAAQIAEDGTDYPAGLLP
jgi:hypothetical protein